MKTNIKRDQNRFLNWAGRGLKYWLLALVGVAIAVTVARVFGANSVVGWLLSASVWVWFWRVGMFVFCLFAIAIILESWS